MIQRKWTTRTLLPGFPGPGLYISLPLFLFLGEKVTSAVLTGSMIASGIIALSPSRRQESQLSIDMIYVVTKLKESIFHNVLGKSACLDVLPVMGVR